MLADIFESSNQSRPQLMQFACMRLREPLQHAPPFTRQTQKGAATVFGIRGSLQQALTLRAIHQLYRAVVLQGEAAGHISDGHVRRPGSARNLQQELMLLRLQSRLQRRGLAEVQKTPQLVAEVGKNCQQVRGSLQRIGWSCQRTGRSHLPAGWVQIAIERHIYIVTRYIFDPPVRSISRV